MKLFLVGLFILISNAQMQAQSVKDIIPKPVSIQELDGEKMILKNASEEDIYNEARKQGFMTMKEDAIIKALEHKIPYEEMNIFGTKVGIEEELIANVAQGVDKPTIPDDSSAIINSNENTTS